MKIIVPCGDGGSGYAGEGGGGGSPPLPIANTAIYFVLVWGTYEE